MGKTLCGRSLLRSDVSQMKGADWSRVTKAFSSFSCEATAGSNFAVDFHIKQKKKIENPKLVDISPISSGLCSSNTGEKKKLKLWDI